MSQTGKKERRTDAGARARELVDALLVRLQELEQQRADDRTELHELAALLGRLEAAYGRLEELELEPMRSVCAWCSAELPGNRSALVPKGSPVSHGICPDCATEQLEEGAA